MTEPTPPRRPSTPRGPAASGGLGAAARGELVRVFVLSWLGLVVLQLAWTLCVPAFEALDEHEHAYKAGAVAAGDLRAVHQPVPGGWGELMWVPADLVAAGRPSCTALLYTDRENCTGPRRDGQEQVATSAARYNPGYYLVVGTLARPFEGSTALYAMRAISGALCAMFIAAAVAMARSGARSRWPAVGLLVAATPVGVYSTMVLAPNGLELSASLLVWSGLLVAVSRVRTGRPVGAAVAVAMVAAVPLVTLRSLGPLWFLLIVATVGLLAGRDSWRRLLSGTRTRVTAGLAVAAGAAGVGWSSTARTNAVGSADGQFPGSLPVIVSREAVLWLFQAVAAFPSRANAAHPAVYALVFTGAALLLGLALRRSAPRARLAIGAVVVVSFAIPASLTVLTYHDTGTIWQGRYGLPYAVGALLIAGWSLDTRSSAAPSRPAQLLVAASMAVALAFSTTGVRQYALDMSAQLRAGAWDPPAPWLVVSLCVVGVALLTAATSWPVPAGPGGQPAEAATQRSNVAAAAPESTAAAARVMPRARASTGSAPGSS